MPSLAKIKSNLKAIPVPFAGETLTITYRIGAMTPRKQSEINERIENGEAQNILIETLAEVLAAWDLTEPQVDHKGNVVMGEDGEPKQVPIPINIQTLTDTPGPLLLAISEAIGEDARPKPKSARGSFAR